MTKRWELLATAVLQVFFHVEHIASEHVYNGVCVVCLCVCVCVHVCVLHM